MAVKPSRLMMERIGDMLVRDKMGVHEGFLSAFSADIARVVGDYFELSSPPAVSVRRGEDGGFEVSVAAERADSNASKPLRICRNPSSENRAPHGFAGGIANRRAESPVFVCGREYCGAFANTLYGEVNYGI